MQLLSTPARLERFLRLGDLSERPGEDEEGAEGEEGQAAGAAQQEQQQAQQERAAGA